MPSAAYCITASTGRIDGRRHAGRLEGTLNGVLIIGIPANGLILLDAQPYYLWRTDYDELIRTLKVRFEALWI